VSCEVDPATMMRNKEHLRLFIASTRYLFLVLTMA
jgi:hypothetical protein